MLYCVVFRGYFYCIEELKKLGVDVNLVDKNSCIFLFYVVIFGNKDCIKTLFKYGVDLNY